MDSRRSERHRFSINDDEVLELARYALIIEKHYGRADGHRMGPRRRRRQAVHPAGAPGNGQVAGAAGIVRKAIKLKQHGKVLATGRAIGQKIGAGPVRIVKDAAEWTGSRPATCWSPT